MSEESIEELEDCGNEMCQEEYEGVFGCQTADLNPAWRRRFRSKQYRTPKVTWDEIKQQFSRFQPTIMCDPCSTPEAMSFSDGFFRHDVTPIHMASLMTIDCGEVDAALCEPQMGVGNNIARDPDAVFRDLLTSRALMQSAGYDDNENCVAFEFMVTEGVELPKSDYLPSGGKLQFKRDEELNCFTQECFGKGQCDTMGVVSRWLEKADCVDGFDEVTDVYMDCDTWEDFKNGDDMKGCLKDFNAQAILGTMFNQLTGQPLIKAKGETLVWVSPEGIRFWKVNFKKRYCTETGEIVKYEMFPKNTLIGYNFGGGPCSYAPVWGYVPVIDIYKSPTGSIKTSVNATSRYTKTKVSWHPAGFKQIMQSNMMPFLPYRNSSTKLTLCADPKSETFKLKGDVVPEAAREENRIAAAVKTLQADKERKEALANLAKLEQEEKAAKAEATAKAKGGK